MSTQIIDGIPAGGNAVDNFIHILSDESDTTHLEPQVRRIAAARLLGSLSTLTLPTDLVENASAFSALLRSKGVEVDPSEEVTIGILVDYGTFARDAWRSAREAGIIAEHNTGDTKLRHFVSLAATVLDISESPQTSYSVERSQASE